MRQSYTSSLSCFNGTQFFNRSLFFVGLRFFTGQLFTGLVVLNLVVATGWSQPTTLPDVVYVLGDDQAWSDYGFMGHPHIKTPNLDRLARESSKIYVLSLQTSLKRPQS